MESSRHAVSSGLTGFTEWEGGIAVSEEMVAGLVLPDGSELGRISKRDRQ